MALRWAAKNVTPIGIDFGSDSVKVLQLLPEDPPHVLAAASIEVPGDARKEPEAQQQFLTGALKDVLRDGGFRGKRVVTSISSAHSYIQHVRPPHAEGDMLQQQIELELRGRLPMDPSNMVVRHIPVGEVVVDGSARQEMICFAASRGYVMRIVNIVKAAGYDVVGMHCEPMAILESFSHLFRRATDDAATTLFVDIGGATTQALISHGNKLVFAKTIHVGGEHFVRQMSEQLKLPAAEVRLRRMQNQPVLAGVAAGGGDSEPDGSAVSIAIAESPQEAEPAADEMLEVIIDELQLCVGYHRSVFPSRKLDKVIFLGGESRNRKLCQAVARSLRLTAQAGCPLARLMRTQGMKVQGLDLNLPQPGWAVPVGLCLLPTNL